MRQTYCLHQPLA